jgi:predicted  nucleic acid-binding Zn-ribbon protein
MVAAVLGFIFDKRIEAWLMAKEFAKQSRWRTDNEIAAINKKIDDIHKDIMNHNRIDEKDAYREIEHLKMQKKYLMSNRLSGA